jgi:uncharacterized protein (DUF1778 family)
VEARSRQMAILALYGNLPYAIRYRGAEMRQAAVRTRKQKKVVSKVYRFDARLDEDQKTLIQRAADLEGRTMTDFVLHSAKIAAEHTIQERAMLVLSARDTEAFVDAILKPAEPGPVLRAAVRAYKNAMTKRARTA